MSCSFGGQVDVHRFRLACAQIAGRVVRVRLGIDPTFLIQSQFGDVAGGAADLFEESLAIKDGALAFGIAGDDAAGNLEGGLENADGGEGAFVGEAIAIRVGAKAEALGGLDAVVLVEGGIGKFAQADDVGGLVPGPDDEHGRTGWTCRR